MRPDKQLAGLLGLTLRAARRCERLPARSTRASAPGAGIVGSTMQFHGTADRYTLNGATAVATLYSNATTATTNPAVTLRSVGSSGGQAAAFTYDLARSVVYTRQGNPAWAGQERDGVSGSARTTCSTAPRPATCSPTGSTRARSRSRRPTSSSGCSSNLITLMERDKLPLPRFWYLPRGEKAVVVMSGDDHSPGRARRHRLQLRPLQGAQPGRLRRRRTGSACARRPTSTPTASLTNAQAAAYVADGFEVALHPVVASLPDGADAPQAQLVARLRHAARRVRGASTRASRRRSRAARTASTGPTGPRTPRSSSPTASAWTRTTTTTPAAGSARSPAS